MNFLFFKTVNLTIEHGKDIYLVKIQGTMAKAKCENC